MTRDTIEGFMFGLGAGFVIAYIVKPPETAVPAGSDIRQSYSGFNDASDRLRLLH